MKDRYRMVRPFAWTALTLMACLLSSSAIYAQSCVVPPSGLIGWWPGDTDASDIQGVNSGVLTNGALAGVSGLVNGAFSFDGVDDYVDIPTSIGLPTSTWTIDFWFFLNTNTTSQAFVTNFDGSGGRYIIEFFLGAGLRIGHFVSNPDLNSFVTPSAGVWHHLAAIQSTNSSIGQKLFFDGNLIGTVGPNGPDPIIRLKFGQRGDGTSFLNGLLDEVEIFNRALSQAEIQAIFNAGSAGKCRDTDGDGVTDDVDLCPGTSIPEADVPSVRLGTNRWALTVDDDLNFHTTSPRGRGPNRAYNTTDTGGCSCEQIIDERGLGNGHTKFGCSISAMDDWVEFVNPSKRGAGADVVEAASVPEAFVLEAVYPNPFNPQTTIRFSVPEASVVKLVVYDVLGREVRVLVDGTREAGTHEVVFEAGNLPSGTYLVRLVTPAGSFVQTMQLVK